MDAVTFNGGILFLEFLVSGLEWWPLEFGHSFCFAFVGIMWLVVGVSAKLIKPASRLQRMRRMFAKDGGILVEDYEHFTRQDAAIPLNKAVHTSAKAHGRQAPRPS